MTETIDIDRLDDRWSSQGENLHLVKLDVEGFEQEVLEGASETIRVHRPTVILELNHWCLNAFRRRTVPDFFDFLRETFPVLRALDHDNRNPRDLHDNDQSYEVMHEHIVKFRYPTIVAGFDRAVAETAAKAPQSV